MSDEYTILHRWREGLISVEEWQRQMERIREALERPADARLGFDKCWPDAHVLDPYYGGEDEIDCCCGAYRGRWVTVPGFLARQVVIWPKVKDQEGAP